MIEPGFEILLGFFLAMVAYFAVTQEIAKIPGIMGIVIFIFATLIAFSNNDIGGIVMNYVYFMIGNALGCIGAIIFAFIIKPFS